MGVQGLWQLLQPTARPVTLESLQGKRLAIDSSIWLYHFQMAMRDKEGRTLANAHLLGFLWRILKLLFYGIRPVFVFDGGAPVQKRRTLANRKQRKTHAVESHARAAEKLLAAQLRQAALAHVHGPAHERDEGLEDNTVYYDSVGRTNRPQVSGRLNEAPRAPEKPKRKDYHKDPYQLPALEEPLQGDVGRKQDLRLATESELRALMNKLAPDDLDTNSELFRSLPPELQYELVGDLRAQSRTTSYQRLQDMLAAAPTPIDFSRAQIAGLRTRNDLTQKVLTITDEIGSANIQVPVRVAGARNREYVLVHLDEGDGGWALGTRDAGTSQDKAIDVDEEERRRAPLAHIEDDDDLDALALEDVEIPDAAPAPDPELDALVHLESDPVVRKERALQLLGARAEHHRRQKHTESGAEAREERMYGRARPHAPSTLFREAPDDEVVEVPAPPISEALRRKDARRAAAGESDEDVSPAREASDDEWEDVAIPQADAVPFADAMHDVEESPKPEPVRAATPPKPRGASEEPEAAEQADSTQPAPVSPAKPQDTPWEGAAIPKIKAEPSTHDLPTPKSHDTPAQHSEPRARGGEVAHLRTPPPLEGGAEKGPEPPTPPAERPDPPRQAPPPTDRGATLDAKPPPEPVAAQAPVPSRPPPAGGARKRSATPPIEPQHASSPPPIPRAEPEPVPVTPSKPAAAEAASPALERPHTHTPEEPPAPAAVPSAPDEASPRASPRDRASASPSPYAWSPSASPEPAAVGADGFPVGAADDDLPSGSDEEEAWADLAAEQTDFASLVGPGGRSVPELRREVEAEVAALRQERARLRRSEEDITLQMAAEVQALLRLFGLPYITAPMEAEAQCAQLATQRLVDGIITDDSDVFLFGGTPVYRNMFNNQRMVECYLLSDIERELSLTRERLISLAFLLGSDYTEGLPGVGPVLAMEILSLYPGPDGLVAFRRWWQQVQIGAEHDPNDRRAKVRTRIKRALRDRVHLSNDWPESATHEAYTDPTVDTSDEPFVWGHADLDGLRGFLGEYLHWPVSKTDQYVLPVIEQQRKNERLRRVQATLDQSGFVSGQLPSELRARPTAAYGSARLQQVVSEFRAQRAGNRAGNAPDDASGDAQGKPPARKRARRRAPQMLPASDGDDSTYEPRQPARGRRRTAPRAADVGRAESLFE
ncbi:DNA repair protein rad2 [Malassezia brasiliensis]|uniref:DNA repair protein rad2 n=1 Tax=Malassezia brasiliensis TaxID=1821822 RepID=A0AAF0DW79_9BASI|nr:DNA repair protein rad2 [Malassezia brasiliensis]